MLTSAITPDIAREMQAKGVLARKRNKELRLLAAIGATVTNVKPVIDPFADDLVHAQTEYLAKLRACNDPKEAAALSQALKNIRETYHMLSLIHISEPTRLLSISYAVFCLKKK